MLAITGSCVENNLLLICHAVSEHRREQLVSISQLYRFELVFIGSAHARARPLELILEYKQRARTRGPNEDTFRHWLSMLGDHGVVPII